ncbi:prolyl oligopeptidase family serine peptidase [Xinfangfangia sp. D13-10-4-6]|uniref:alpha/beta hydrolase n=1 Tax=Pseudogemmobacter hezensis TaxID=2737662 RepID=UPI0015580F78|nr:dienelactone hydrolase family protein [Pseudogemmobacter hezensis]NPD14978.1 prolyl oligopeptidase family serine peptidase [Pseudogemmobacter hezensis]
MSRSLVIFLHGVGSRGADLAPLGDAWRALLPSTDFAAPDGPFAFDHSGSGRQWFSVKGVTEANRPGRILAARDAFDHTIAGIVAAHGLTGQPDRVALVGFSQGSIMALDALASGRWPVAAVVAFAGRLASPAPMAPSTGSRVLLVHGDGDRVMPVEESRTTAAALKQAGVDVALNVLPGLGHTISPEGATAAGAFLSHVLTASQND